MKIGLTGGIGSGKTTVTNYLLRKGYPVIDADKIAREITLPRSPILRQLSEAFGGDIIREDGSLNRKLLAEKAFSSEGRKRKLDEITHGEIRCRILKRLDENREPLIFVDAPLLFEVELDKNVDTVWLLIADKEMRVERVAVRDDVPPGHVRARIDSQMEEEEKKKRADVVIYNTGTKEELYQKIDKLLSQCQGS